MGKTKRGSKFNRNSGDDTTLTDRPFKESLKDVVVKSSGPECLVCKLSIDTRPSWSLSHQKGPRKIQRHGYTHWECEVEAVKSLATKQGKTFILKNMQGVLDISAPGLQLEVPVYEENDLNATAELSGEGS